MLLITSGNSGDQFVNRSFALAEIYCMCLFVFCDYNMLAIMVIFL